MSLSNTLYDYNYMFISLFCFLNIFYERAMSSPEK